MNKHVELVLGLLLCVLKLSFQDCPLPEIENGKAVAVRASVAAARSLGTVMIPVGGSIQLVCDAGFNFTERGSNRAVCDDTGEWFPPLASCQFKQHDFSQCGISFKERIMGGSYASPGEFPWMARLDIFYKNGNPKDLCGGSIINSEWILTAAHCVTRFPISTILLTFGKNNFSVFTSSTERIGVADVILTHPLYNYSSNLINDFALIKLFAPLKFTTHIRPICLPDDLCTDESASSMRSETFDSCPNGREKILSAGWGITETGQSSDSLKKIYLTVISREKCREQTKYPFIAGSQMCALVPDADQQDTCQGDSGGPLMCMSNGTAHIIGLVSYGGVCGTRNVAAVYSRVCSAMQWIRETIASGGTSTASAAISTTTITTTAPATTAAKQCRVPTLQNSKIFQGSENQTLGLAESQLTIVNAGDMIGSGDHVTLRCNPGFEFPLGSPISSTCLQTGSWSRNLRSCVRVTTTTRSTTTRSTATSTTIRRTTRIAAIQSRSTTAAPTTCVVPHRSNGLLYPFAFIGGDLSGSQTVSAGDRMLQGRRVTLICNDGFRLGDDESNSVICGADGSWSGRLGLCIETVVTDEPTYGTTMMCDANELPDIAGGHFPQPSAYGSQYSAIGTVFKGICDEGLVPTTNRIDDLRTECRADGTWSRPLTECSSRNPINATSNYGAVRTTTRRTQVAYSSNCDGFACANGNCIIQPSWVCDGDNDCQDMSDEINCPTIRTSTRAIVRTTPQGLRVNCSGFRCTNGGCIGVDERCNGINECNDKSDETNCGSSCREYQCANRNCVLSSFRCDGDNDCGDMSDERNCGASCRQYRCGNNNCVHMKYVCDGDNDCGDMTDENISQCSSSSSGGAYG